MKKIIKIGAGQYLYQKVLAESLAAGLQKHGIESVIVPMENQLDSDEFKKYIDSSLQNNIIDTAVVYLDELKPAGDDSAIIIAALSERLYNGECIIVCPDMYDETSDISLKKQTKITASNIRQATQIKRLNGDLDVQTIDGSFEYLIDYLFKKNTDAIILTRVMYEHTKNLFTNFKLINLHPREMISAPGHGVMAYLSHRDDKETRTILKLMHQTETSRITNIERDLMRMAGPEYMNSLGVYVYKDHKNYFHANAIRCDTLKKTSFSQSTSLGMSEHLFKLLF